MDLAQALLKAGIVVTPGSRNFGSHRRWLQSGRDLRSLRTRADDRRSRRSRPANSCIAAVSHRLDQFDFAVFADSLFSLPDFRLTVGAKPPIAPRPARRDRAGDRDCPWPSGARRIYRGIVASLVSGVAATGWLVYQTTSVRGGSAASHLAFATAIYRRRSRAGLGKAAASGRHHFQQSDAVSARRSEPDTVLARAGRRDSPRQRATGPRTDGDPEDHVRATAAHGLARFRRPVESRRHSRTGAAGGADPRLRICPGNGRVRYRRNCPNRAPTRFRRIISNGDT